MVEYYCKHCDITQQPDTICDAMSCLLYNTHIIEDRYHSKVYYGAITTLLLADASPQTETVTHDLLACLPNLFPRQKEENDADYLELVSGIRRVEGNIISERRNVNSKDDFLLIDRKYAVELKGLLAQHIPQLLQKQAWFTQVFPLRWFDN